MARLFILLILILPQVCFSASISPRTYNVLTEIQEQISQQPDSETVIELNEELNELASDLKGNSLAMALIYQTHAQLKSYENNESESQAYLLKALKLENLKSDTAIQIRSMLAYSYFNMGNYKDSIKQLNIVIENAEKPSANIYALLAASFYSTEDYESGLPHIEKAIELSDNPKEGWLQMAFSGNYQAKEFTKAVYYVNQLVFNYPDKKDYWQQKAGIHQIQEQYQQASATKELFYKKGFIDKESDYINLGQLLASQGNAYKVGLALEKALDTKVLEPSEKILNLLYQSWLQAKENSKARIALVALFNQYKKVDDGYQLLQYLIDAELWGDADRLANELIDLELTSKQRGKVYLYHGMVKYRLGDARAAIKLLGKSTAFENSSSQAKGWMNYIKQMSS